MVIAGVQRELLSDVGNCPILPKRLLHACCLLCSSDMYICCALSVVLLLVYLPPFSCYLLRDPCSVGVLIACHSAMHMSMSVVHGRRAFINKMRMPKIDLSLCPVICS